MSETQKGIISYIYRAAFMRLTNKKKKKLNYIENERSFQSGEQNWDRKTEVDKMQKKMGGKEVVVG